MKYFSLEMAYYLLYINMPFAREFEITFHYLL